MIYTTLGKTGLKVSKMGFGCAPLGNEYGNFDKTEGIRAVHIAIDAGINFFDKSPYYGRTLSETRLGEALRGKRDKVILATKGGRLDRELESGFDFTYDRIIRMCEECLQRLQTDYLDVHQLHDIEFGKKEVIVEAGIRALHDLKEQGKVCSIGVTGYLVRLLHEMAETQELDVTLSYAHGNLMNQMMDEILVPVGKEKGMGLINASVTHLGILTHQGPQDWHPAPEVIKVKRRELARFCEAWGASLPELAIQFALANEQVDVTLLGTKTVADLEASLPLIDKPIDQELLTNVEGLIESVKNMSWSSGYEEYWENTTG